MKLVQHVVAAVRGLMPPTPGAQVCGQGDGITRMVLIGLCKALAKEEKKKRRRKDPQDEPLVARSVKIADSRVGKRKKTATAKGTVAEPDLTQDPISQYSSSSSSRGATPASGKARGKKQGRSPLGKTNRSPRESKSQKGKITAFIARKKKEIPVTSATKIVDEFPIEQSQILHSGSEDSMIL